MVACMTDELGLPPRDKEMEDVQLLRDKDNRSLLVWTVFNGRAGLIGRSRLPPASNQEIFLYLFLSWAYSRLGSAYSLGLVSMPEHELEEREGKVLRVFSSGLWLPRNQG